MVVPWDKLHGGLEERRAAAFSAADGSSSIAPLYSRESMFVCRLHDITTTQDDLIQSPPAGRDSGRRGARGGA